MVMKKLFRDIVSVTVYLSAISLIPVIGQEKEGMVKYTPDFRFKDGIYLNFDQVKMNNPIPKAKLLTSADYNDKEFFKDLMESDKIYFYDNMGIRQEVNKSDIWGYARNGVLYIQVQNNFNRITYIGNICHFVADIMTYDPRYYNYPYGYGGYYDPYYSYYSPYSYYGNYYNPYGSYYSPYSRNISRSEIKQFIIDFETGKVMDFDLENTELLLMKDAQLYEEYVQLPRKKKKEMMFVYIRKFNEKNPLYLPETE
jgi:hypothetical protein